MESLRHPAQVHGNILAVPRFGAVEYEDGPTGKRHWLAFGASDAGHGHEQQEATGTSSRGWLQSAVLAGLRYSKAWLAVTVGGWREIVKIIRVDEDPQRAVTVRLAHDG